jgi:hypothetical protein
LPALIALMPHPVLISLPPEQSGIGRMRVGDGKKVF